MRKRIALTAITIQLIVVSAASASSLGTKAHHGPQRPLFWTIAGGNLLPITPHIPVRWTRCTRTMCVGKLGKVDGHSVQWLIGRDPVWIIFHDTPQTS